MSPERSGFILVCILGIVAIAVAAGLEAARFRRGDSIGGQRQFRLRMMSSVVWFMVLAVNLYAVTALWPSRGTSPEAKAQAKHFLLAVGGGFSLLIIALVLLLVDLLQLARERRLQEERFKAELINLARDEAAKARNKEQA